MKLVYLTAIIISATYIMYSCGPGGSKSEVSDSSDEYVEEEDGEEEDKSMRPSPPRTTTANVSGVNVTIDYSAPAVKERKIFGELEPYGKVWRTGANEATVFTTDADILINGDEVLPQGQYALFTIPGESEWTVIFNNEPNQWGAFNYNEDLDQLRITLSPEKREELTERLNFTVSPDGVIKFAWEYVSLEFKVEKD